MKHARPNEPPNLDYQGILEDIAEELEPLFGSGKIADYIPALAAVSPDKFGMAISTVAGETYRVGDAAELFSIQSISKVLTLTMASRFVGGEIWRRLGREPSGNRFNSLVQLEYEHGIPRNPFINAGALLVADVITSHSPYPKQEIATFVEKLVGKAVPYDETVARSEKDHGYRNLALVSFMKSFGNIDNPIEVVLDVYFHQCSLAMSCLDLAKAFSYLANRGVLPATGEVIVPPQRAKRINSIMLTCGLYDAVGDFAFRVGLPGKSGVGGGIVAIVPDQMSLCVWSPGLDPSGNSLVGIRALELFTDRTGTSIF
jgi:glutaminase